MCTLLSRLPALALLLLAGFAFATAAPRAAAAAPQCHSSRLYVDVSGTNGAAGTIGITLRFRNISPETCSLYGFPGMQLVTSGGQNLPTHLSWGQGMMIGNHPKTTVLIKPGASAYAEFQYSDVPTGKESCPAASYLLVTPPNERATVIVPVSDITPCGGRISVTPVLATAPL